MTNLPLPSQLNLSAASDLLARLKDASDAGEDCSLSGAEVTTVGAACIQVLLAFDAALREQGRRLYLIDPAPAFLDGMRILGLEHVALRWMRP